MQCRSVKEASRPAPASKRESVNTALAAIVHLWHSRAAVHACMLLLKSGLCLEGPLGVTLHRGSHCAVQAKIETSKPAPGNAAAATGPAAASLRDSGNVATAAAAHRHAPSEAYELEDLDEDWVAMLNMLDNRLLEVRVHQRTCNIVHSDSSHLCIEFYANCKAFEQPRLGTLLHEVIPSHIFVS